MVKTRYGKEAWNSKELEEAKKQGYPVTTRAIWEAKAREFRQRPGESAVDAYRRQKSSDCRHKHPKKSNILGMPTKSSMWRI